MSDWLADWLDQVAKKLRRVRRCPSCNSSLTRANTASPVKGAMLCDSCGCRWKRA